MFYSIYSKDCIFLFICVLLSVQVDIGNLMGFVNFWGYNMKQILSTCDDLAIYDSTFTLFLL